MGFLQLNDVRLLEALAAYHASPFREADLLDAPQTHHVSAMLRHAYLLVLYRLVARIAIHLLTEVVQLHLEKLLHFYLVILGGRAQAHVLRSLQFLFRRHTPYPLATTARPQAPKSSC